MEGSFHNTSVNVTAAKAELCGPDVSLFLTLTDIITVVFGHPISAALLWMCLKSRKTLDLLNCNLALFHNVLYWMCLVHVLALHFQLKIKDMFLKFILMYAQIGSPMSLLFICIQRLVAVIYPTSYVLLKKYRYSEICSVSVWITTVPTAYFFTILVNIQSAIAEGILTGLPCALMLLMIGMMVETSVCTVRKLKNALVGREKFKPANRKAFVAMAAMTAIAVFFYLPVVVIQQVTDNAGQDCLSTPMCLFLLSLASVVHPLFYLSTQTKCWRKKTREDKT